MIRHWMRSRKQHPDIRSTTTVTATIVAELDLGPAPFRTATWRQYQRRCTYTDLRIFEVRRDPTMIDSRRITSTKSLSSRFLIRPANRYVESMRTKTAPGDPVLLTDAIRRYEIGEIIESIQVGMLTTVQLNGELRDEKMV
jgi:hypothetical protein